MFYVGQKVVCVEDRGQVNRPEFLVKKGVVYTVVRVYKRPVTGTLSLEFFELPPPPEPYCFPAKYFRPLQERKNDGEAFVRKLKEDCMPKEIERV